MIIIIHSNCKKQIVEPMEDLLPLRLKMADANADITIELPSNRIVLNGRAMSYYQTKQITQTSWKKISGPSSCIIENANSIQTKVSNLEKGTYQFELTVYDNSRNFDIDTMTLNLVDPSGTNKQIFFGDMKMIGDHDPLWASFYLAIENFHEFIPVNTALTVYLKMEPSSNWEQVILYPQNDPFFTGYVYFNPTNFNNASLIIKEFPVNSSTTLLSLLILK